MRGLFVAAALASAACAQQPLNEMRAANPPTPLGDWTVEFRLDSVRVRDGSGVRWSAASFATTRGTLQVLDSIDGRPGYFRTAIQVSFDALLGRPMSCFDPRPTSTVIQRSENTVTVRFTPNGADCGFGASGTVHGDSIVGTWDESSFAGPVVMGRFRMWRGR